MFRTENKDRMIKMKIISKEPFYIFLSKQEKLVNNTHYLEFLPTKIKLGKFITRRGKDIHHALTEAEAQIAGEDHSLWMLMKSNKIFTGPWMETSLSVLAAFDIYGLSEMNHIGFSSFQETKWEVQNGKYILL